MSQKHYVDDPHDPKYSCVPYWVAHDDSINETVLPKKYLGDGFWIAERMDIVDFIIVSEDNLTEWYYY